MINAYFTLKFILAIVAIVIGLIEIIVMLIKWYK